MPKKIDVFETLKLSSENYYKKKGPTIVQAIALFWG